MGLIQAGIGAIGGVLADQWKEFFYCEALPNDVLMTKGEKRIGNRSSNTKGSDNIISNGSGIAVADGQAMIIVEQGKVVEFCAVPGEYTFDKSTEPSIFAGKFGQSLIDTFKLIGKRFAYGGDTGKDQRVYYFNTKEILENKFGSATPIPFRIVNRSINLDFDVNLRVSGIYSYILDNPLIFYTNIAGNVTDTYRRDQIDGQLKIEFVSSLAPALAKLSDMELRPNQIPAHNQELEAAMNEVLTQKWIENRGIRVKAVALNPITLTEEDEKRYQEAQRAGMYRDPGMAGGRLVDASSDAMKGAASNAGGAMTGFMGLGMAQGMGGGAANMSNLFAMNQQNQQAAQAQAQAANSWKCECGADNTGKFCANCGKPKPAPSGSWKCECGADNTGKFCANCGKPKPAPSGSWKCECGADNTGRFCANCGRPKPDAAEAPKPAHCDKCGWVAPDTTPVRFCPQCGNKLN